MYINITMSILSELNSGFTPTVWNRKTVADGDYLQSNTIGPIFSGEQFLATQLDLVKNSSDYTFSYLQASANNLNSAYTYSTAHTGTLTISGYYNGITSNFSYDGTTNKTAGLTNIFDKISADIFTRITYKVVSDTADIIDDKNSTLIYLIAQSGATPDAYYEYIYNSNTSAAEMIGDTSLSLSGYATKTNLSDAIDSEDVKLKDLLRVETETRTAEDAALESEITAEIANRTEADTSLQNQINGKISSVTADGNVVSTTTSDNNVSIKSVPFEYSTSVTDLTPKFGDTISIPSVNSVDSYGRVANIDTKHIVLPNEVVTTSSNGLMTSNMLSSLESKLDSITSDNILVTATKSGTGVSLTSVVANPRTTTSNATPSFGGTFSFYHIDGNDNYGRVTVVDDLSVTIPSTVATTTASGLMSSSDKSKLDGISVDGYQGNLTTLYCSNGGTNVISGNTNLRKGVHLASFQGTTYDTSFTQGDTIKMQAIDTTTSEVLGEGVFTVPTTGTNLAVTILCRFYNANSSHYLNFKLIKVSSSSTGTTTFVNALVQEIAWRA